MVFTDNVGKILAAHFTAPAIGKVRTVSCVDILGVSYTLVIISTVNNLRYNGGTHKLDTRIGKGTTPATPQDFQLEDPFVGGAESGSPESFPPSYITDSGVITQASVFTPISQTIAISEQVQYADMKEQGATVKVFMMTRNIVDPPVNANLNDTVNVENSEFF